MTDKCRRSDVAVLSNFDDIEPIPDNVQSRAKIQIFHVPDCLRFEETRALLVEVLARSGANFEVLEIEGPYPSPTLLIEGTDVTGRAPRAGSACRLDLPTEGQIITALARVQQTHTCPTNSEER